MNIQPTTLRLAKSKGFKSVKGKAVPQDELRTWLRELGYHIWIQPNIYLLEKEGELFYNGSYYTDKIYQVNQALTYEVSLERCLIKILEWKSLTKD